MSEDRPAVLLRDNPDGSEYEAVVDGKVIGIIGYEDARQRRILINTAVDPEYRHHGVAHQLIAYALDDVRDHHQTISIMCPIVGEFIQEHPEYAGLIDPEHPGRAPRPA